MKARLNSISEPEVYDQVYDYYKGRCILTGKKLDRGYTYMYPHLFPKGAYPKLRLTRNNIVLVQSTILHEEVDKLFTRIRNDIGKYELLEMIQEWKDLAPLIKQYYDSDS